jgi:hypothetical protein
MIASNPFSTRFTRPGALRYVTPDAELARMLAIIERGGRFAIVGAHGTGKTTLLHTLRDVLCERGLATITLSLRDGGSKRTESRTPGQLPAVLFVDGYEQLSGPRRLLVGRGARALVVTTHTPALTVLARTDVTADLAEQLVRTLLSRFPDSAVTARDAPAALANAGGNMREAFFSLYDVHERNRARASGFSQAEAQHVIANELRVS